jgi:hypothetical protein
MKRVMFALLLSFAFVALAFADAPQKPDFSGTWALDKSKSEGLPPQLQNQILTVTQKGDKVDIQAKVTTDQGEDTISDSYTVDGKEAPFTPKGPGGLTGTGKRTTHWSADGKSLEAKEDATFDVQGNPVSVQSTRNWTLSPDGKTLTIMQTISSPEGEQQVKRVFTKK